jgi:hypothetical protein
MVYAIAKAQWGNIGAGVLAAAAFVTVPGALLQTGLATGEMISTFLLIAAAWYWSMRGSASMSGSLLSGILFGLSCATRMSALIALPALIIWSVLNARITPRAILHAIVASVIASAVFLLALGTYYLAFRPHLVEIFARDMAESTGVEQQRGIQSILSYFVTSESLFPVFIMVVAAVSLISSPPTVSFARIRPFCALLLLIGVIGWMAWIVKAPIPHLRYLWPALPSIWLGTILLLLHWLITLKPNGTRLLLHVTIISVWATQFSLSFRQLYLGDSLMLVYEAARRTSIDWRQPFRARHAQEGAAAVIAGLPADARVYARIDPVAYPITWLTNRKILSLSEFSASVSANADQYLILFPSDKNIWPATLPLRNWIQANTTLFNRIDDYYVYRINANAPMPTRSL